MGAIPKTGPFFRERSGLWLLLSPANGIRRLKLKRPIRAWELIRSAVAEATLDFSQGFPIPGYCCPALAMIPSTPNSVKNATTKNTINAGKNAARMALPAVSRWVTCTALT